MARYKVIIKKDAEDSVQYTLYRKIWKFFLFPAWELLLETKDAAKVADVISDLEWRMVVKSELVRN